jgi:type 1 glutamine amidotransferase
MTSDGKKVLIMLGGLWHDFDGFAGAILALLEPRGFKVEATYDLEKLLHLEEDRYDLVISYTCFSPHREGYNDISPEKLTDAQIGGLTKWVRNGGALLAAHSATVMGESDPALGELIGGVFVSHPEPFTFTVYPVFGEHPLMKGIEPFTVHDEFYMETHMPSVNVHMVAFDRGVAYPMVWSKAEGQGRVAHIAPGHFREVWDLTAYQQLLFQTIDWLIEKYSVKRNK